ncbi:helix-turn-helix transcriptional regulator [Streptomyces sp. NPDC057908]|uniref:helix-turn-helix transcriptional regulator n=1 Tax=Streptomyces sp. NPDC057908 TaxID=3346276 RepID=UPI0036F16FAE
MPDPSRTSPLSSLIGVDVDATAERVYRTLVSGGPALGPDLAGLLGISVKDIETAIGALRQVGLVDMAAGGGISAVSPSLALEGMVAQREQQVRAARTALDELAEEYRRAREVQLSNGIEIVRGRSEIGSWLNGLLLSAKEQLRMFAKPPFAVFGISESDTEREVAGRGLRERIIIERTVLDEPAAEKDLVASLDRGQGIRMVQSLPAKLLIVDDSIAIVQLDEGGHAHSEIAVVRPGGLLDCLVFSFESLWRSAMQLREAPGRRVDPNLASPKDLADPADRKVLMLLLAGYTDAAVAARLGISLRTMQRRVRRLMDLAGTESRVLLGWHARDRGWL